MDDTQETGEAVETSAQETENVSVQNQASEELAAIRYEMAALKEQLMATSQSKPQEPAVTFTQAELQQIQQNPALLAEWMKKQAAQAKNEIQNESQKHIWDLRTEEKFPLIKTDKEFQKRVSAKIKEITSTGEYSKENPMLLYRATTLAAAEYAPKTKTTDQSKNFVTSVEGRTSAPRESGSRPKIDGNDPRVRAAELLGISGKKLEAFKASLGVYIPPQRKQGRRLMK